MPDRYTDFADPKYKGELVFLDDPFGNIWLWAKSIGVPDPSKLTKAQLDETMKALLKVKPNIVTMGASLGDMADIMIRGDASMGLGGWAYQTIIAKQKGTTLVVGSPKVDDRFFGYIGPERADRRGASWLFGRDRHVGLLAVGLGHQAWPSRLRVTPVELPGRYPGRYPGGSAAARLSP